MGEQVHAIDVQEVISYGDDLLKLLKSRKDIDGLTQSIQGAKLLLSSCNTDYSNVQNLLEENQRQVETCTQEISKARDESDLEPVQRDLADKLLKEKILLEELRAVNDEIEDLEKQRVSVEERKEALKKAMKEELRLQKLLSMYASMTNLIPDLSDESKISGHIVDRDKKRIEKFEFDPLKASSSEICNTLWKAMDQ
ncbi:kinetochore protein SPC24 homolog [Aristolochia californica]|uniref:kinetochore protein SPC24 homolog n=1 Tax=Aristolochia californica TaxID=171875 RepID=UPI0035D7F39C